MQEKDNLTLFILTFTQHKCVIHTLICNIKNVFKKVSELFDYFLRTLIVILLYSLLFIISQFYYYDFFL